MRPRRRRRWGRIALVAIGALAVVVAVAIGGYIDTNIHYYERDLQKVADAGFVEKQADVEGYRIAYAEGPRNGTPLLLIHGQGSRWQDHAKVLPALAANFHVFAVDVPGHGGSARLPAQEYTNVRVGGLLASFLEQVVGEPAVVSGHSSGGLLATWIAANRPELVRGVVLEDPPLFSSIMPRAEKTTGVGLMRQAQAYLEAGGGSDFQRHFVENGDYFGFFGPLQGPIVGYARGYLDDHPGEPLQIFYLPPVVNVFFRGLVDYDPAFGAAWMDNGWYSGFDTEAALSAIEVPVTLIHTTYWYDHNGTYYSEDGVLMAAMDDRDVARALEHLRDAELVRISSGHLVHFERPDEYIAAVTGLAARAGA